MSWVWHHSGARGGARLVLLAIADAADADGSNAWPTLQTIAAKCQMTGRNVRRCVAELVEAGELRVDYNAGGRPDTPADRRPNRYTVVMDDADRWGDNMSSRALNIPVENRGDKLSSRLSGGTDCPQRGDIRVRAGGRGRPPTRPTPPIEPSTTRVPVPARDEPVPSAADGGGGGEAHHGVAAVLAALHGRWRLSLGQRERLTGPLADALHRGWDPGSLAAHLDVNPASVRSPYAVLASRLADLPDPRTRPPRPRPPWCGACDEHSRLREDNHGRVTRCPDCHPLRAAPRPVPVGRWNEERSTK